MSFETMITWIHVQVDGDRYHAELSIEGSADPGVSQQSG